MCFIMSRLVRAPRDAGDCLVAMMSKIGNILNTPLQGHSINSL